MPVDPAEILLDVNPNALPADEPPDIADYREAELKGVSCAFCAKFRPVEWIDQDGVMVPIGICSQWEAKVDGLHISNAFASNDPAIDNEGNEVWSEFSDQATIDREFFFPADEGLELSTEDGLIWKDILREGEWSVTPTLAGPIDKPLRIVADGETDYKGGVISLADIEQAFNDDAVQYVQVPLTDEPGKDHKEMARLNQGFVKKLKRVVGQDGKARLRAGILFTEPETAEKVKRGTYADVSAKITPHIRKRDNKFWRAALRHVCITNTPWIDGMDPFGAGVAASDDQQATTVESYQLSERLNTNDERLSLEWRKGKANEALHAQLALSDNYSATDIVGSNLTIRNDIAGTTWTVPYRVTTDGIELSAVKDWELYEDEDIEPVQEEETPPPAQSSRREETPLEKARRLRGLRLSQADTTNGGSHMPRTGIEELDGLELSDDARAVFQRMQARLSKAEKKEREEEAEKGVETLRGLGFSDCPGALALYRSVSLEDDGMPVVEFSDEAGAKHSPSAKELLDQFIHALTGGKQIAIQLSDQAENHGNNEPPPAEDGETPYEERLASAKAAIGQK